MGRQQIPGWAIYLRVSDEDKQSPERSFAMQRQRIQEHLLTASDIPFFREYRDVLTGTTSNRADYQRLLADAEVGRFSHLGLYRADRFGRDTLEGLQAATYLINLGVRIRVAHSPTLRPETPDGSFMFVLEMAMAQREVDVLVQRSLDGREAKMRAGGWAAKAPDGYLNKEELISSGKYRRWVEPDPHQSKVWREAWDMLITGRYTLAQICEVLHSRGYTRASGKPWVWNDPKTGDRRTAANKLAEGFHRPFYAGWVVSKSFGIQFGEVRGNWEPIITTGEFECGLEILRQHDYDKSRQKRHVYLLRGLLWMKYKGRAYRMYCQTPTGRSATYKYYMTKAKIEGNRRYVRCQVVDSQIPAWLQGITVDPKLLPTLREIYRRDVNESSIHMRTRRRSDAIKHLNRLREEEASLARLFATDRLSEQTYDRLRAEWQAKLYRAKQTVQAIDRTVERYIDDLDTAIFLLSRAHILFERLDKKKQATLLRILAKRIIVDTQGHLIDFELESPFAYLTALVNETSEGNQSTLKRGSRQIPSSTDPRN